MIWEVKQSNGTWKVMKTPSEYTIDYEDMDNDSYRSISTGNLIDSVISYQWSKVGFGYNELSQSQALEILQEIRKNPVVARLKNPAFVGGILEAEFRCSKKSIKMRKNKKDSTANWAGLSFNLVQKKKVSGQ